MALALNKYSVLLRLLEFAEIDGNWTAIETFINGLVAGTAGYEAGNALKLGGVLASGYAPVNGSSSNAFATAAISAAGVINSTSPATIPISFSGATINQSYGSIVNTGGALVWGVVASTGGPIGNSGPYEAFIGSNTAKNFNLVYNGSVVASITSSTLLVPGIYAATTASAANTFVDSTGKLFRSTSSERYKTDIEPLTAESADKLMLAQPIWYRSRCADDNPAWSFYGLSAEKLAEIDPRYVFWSPQYKTVPEMIDEQVPVTESITVFEESVDIIDGRAVLIRTPKTVDQPVYDEYPLFDQAGQPVMVDVDGTQQQVTYRQPRMTTRPAPRETRIIDETLPLIPDGVQYERLTVALLSIVQRQQQRIVALEGK